MGWFRRGNPIDPEELERVKEEVRSLREALAAADERRQQQEAEAVRAAAAAEPRPDPRLDELAAKLTELDQRVTAVSTELANQMSELNNDIEALAKRPPGSGADEVVLDELRDGQVRLANEQARYQIAFREDLARLAEQLRRPLS